MPLTICKEPQKGILLGVWLITETTEELISQCHLNDEDLPKLNNFKISLRRKQWLGYRILLQSLVSKNFPLCKICYTDTGIPYLLNPKRNISVSHSGKYAVAIVSENLSIYPGIDIEKISNKIIQIRKKFLNTVELLNASCNPSALLYTMLWTGKESIYKCCRNNKISFKNDIYIYSIKKYKDHWILKGKVFFPLYADEFVIHSEQIDDFMLSYTLSRHRIVLHKN